MSGLAGRYHLLVLPILMILLVTTGTARAIAAPDLTQRSCQAADATAFIHCVEQGSHGEVDRIVVTAVIKCGHDLACGASLSGINRPFDVTGGAAGAGFSRDGDNRASFGIRIETSSGPITVRNLQFNMGRRAPHGEPGAIWTDPDCPTIETCPSEAIAIRGSANVMVDQVGIADAPRFGISIVGSSSVTIRRSNFSRSGLHGIWVAQTPATRGLHIENNKFIDTRSNAAMLSGLPPDAGDPLGSNTVTGNLFDHNHNAAVYHVCGALGHGPCAGGQLDVEHQSASFLIADNEFRHGSMDEDRSLVGEFHIAGIEVAPLGVKEIMIYHNYFHNLSDKAIAIDSAEVMPEVLVDNNVFEHLGDIDHGLANVDRSGKSNEQRHYAAQDNDWQRPRGLLTASLCKPTYVKHCGLIIRWRGQFNQLPLRVIVNGQKVFAKSSPIGGQKSTSRTNARQMRLDLYAGATLLDTMPLGLGP